MTFVLDTVQEQAIALLGLAQRDTAGVPEYSTDLGDTTYAAEEIERAAQSAVTEIMKTICETDGHPHRILFTAPQALNNASELPEHFGSIGVPRITPYSGATFNIVGKRKSVEEIEAYRANPGSMYSAVAHNVAVSAGRPSKLAGFYAIDEATQIIYFTGFSALANICNFVEADYELLPDIYYPLAIDLCIAKLKKDGDISDIFTYYAESAAAGLAMIRGRESDQPSRKKTVGVRDSGMK